MVMNLRGTEVLHASSVWSRGRAIAFVGNGGQGKSTLAASLVQEGLALISDDAVPLVPDGARIRTSNGPPEMNLWPRSWRLLNPNGRVANSGDKLLIRLAGNQHRAGNFPLAHIYFLKPSDQTAGAKVKPIGARETLMELVRAAHRLDLTDAGMLRRQLNTLHRVAKLVTAKALSYPAGIPKPGELATAVISDLACDS